MRRSSHLFQFSVSRGTILLLLLLLMGDSHVLPTTTIITTTTTTVSAFSSVTNSLMHRRSFHVPGSKLRDCCPTREGATISSSFPRRVRRATITITTTITTTSSVSRQHFMLPPSLFDFHPSSAFTDGATSFLTAVETFDGNEVVDPVVVSSVFWKGLRGKILPVLIGQVLAVVVFASLSSLLASNAARIKDRVRTGVFGRGQGERARENVSEWARNDAAVDRSKTPSVEPDFAKLLLCVVIDIVGTSSELVPIVGELSDVVWAPIAAVALRSMYGSNIIFALEFAEEILPLTDILPLATICWVIDTFYGETDIARFLQIGKFGQKREVVNGQKRKREPINGEGIIDVQSESVDSPLRQKRNTLSGRSTLDEDVMS